MGERGMIFFKNEKGELSKSLYTQWGGPYLAILASDFIKNKENLIGKLPNQVLLSFARFHSMGVGEHIRDTSEEETNLDHGNWRIVYSETTGIVSSFMNFDTGKEFDLTEARERYEMYYY